MEIFVMINLLAEIRGVLTLIAVLLLVWSAVAVCYLGVRLGRFWMRRRNAG